MNSDEAYTAKGNPDQLEEIATFALKLARRAGEAIVRQRETNRVEHRYKDQQELVTNADLEADRIIIDAIGDAYPGHRILSEESSPALRDTRDLESPLWIVDPIDGTVNYAYGHSQVAVSIAWARDATVQVGVVHCPFQAETFLAIKGRGATCNERPLRHSGCRELGRALVATGFPYGKDALAPLVARLDRVLHACRDIRRIGSAAMDICWVAAGRLDAYYETVSPWDCAAAMLIAGEAGASCGHFIPVPAGRAAMLWSENLLICAPDLFAPLKSLLSIDPATGEA